MQEVRQSTSFHLAVSDIHIEEMRKLKRRKYIMHSVMSIIAIVNVTIYIFYYTKACEKNDFYLADEYKNWRVYQNEIEKPLLRFTRISFMLLGIIFFTTGCVMLNRLRLYFVDFYKE